MLPSSCPVAAAQSRHLAAPSAVAPQITTRENYVGSAACAPCHRRESEAWQTNAHQLTSRPADAHSIAGNFAPGANLFKTANPALSFHMTADPNGFYQTATDEVAPGKTLELTRRFDIVIGSSTKAQTYLYWKDLDLFELPVSWWTLTHQWINSPGYQDGAMRFDRIIVPRCLECHSSYFQSLAPPPNHYEPASLVLGIECEKCHGPGRDHVALYSTPQSQGATHKAAPANRIINPNSLPRNRQIDSCALCHAGLGETLAPALSYKPGDALEKYLRFSTIDPGLPVDVHGNQVQLLERSHCFRASSMTCSTCHKVHQPEPETAPAYSHYCLECHQPKQCGEFKKLGEAITRDCVNCHMPLDKSQALFSNSNDQTLQLPVRNHRIAVYPAAVGSASLRATH